MSEFKFSQNKDTKALKPSDSVKTKKKAVGRPLEQKSPRNKQVGCYLTQEEFEELKEKLDGRSASTLIRRLILDYSTT